MANTKSIARWIYIINTVRAIPETDLTKTALLIDNRRLQMEFFDTDLIVYDPITNEAVVCFNEDGHPFCISDWADTPVNWDQFDYPMYEGQA